MSFTGTIDGKQIKFNTVPITKLSDTIAGTKILGTGIMLGLTDAPTQPYHLTNKEYVDSVASGLDPKESARVATTSDLGLFYNGANNTLSGTLPVIDGVTLTVGDRVLVKDQTDNKQNGIYSVTDSSTLTRAYDHDNTPMNEVSGGNYIFIEAGTANNSTGWVLKGNGNLILNTDPLLWVQFTGVGLIDAGAGLAKNANTLYVVAGLAIDTNGDAVNVKYDGNKLMVDGTNQLTIKPFGITNGDLANTSVNARTIANDVAGLGLIKSAFTGALDVNVDNVSLEVFNDILQVRDNGISENKLNDSVAGDGIIRNATTKKLDAKGDETSITVTSGGISIKNDGVTANKVNADVAGNGLVKNVGTGALDVNVDGTSLKIVSDVISINNVNATAIDASVAGNGLVKNVGTGALDINIDGITLDIVSDTLKVKPKGISTNEIKSTNTAAAGDVAVANADGTFTFTNLNSVSAKLRLTANDRHRSPLATVGNYQPTGIMLTGVPKGYVMVYVNGQLQNLTDDLLGDCYFSTDGGVTATPMAAYSSLVPIQLYWNGNIAGFALETSDKLDLIYEI